MFSEHFLFTSLNEPFSIAPDVIILHRGDGESVWMNGAVRKPLYIRRGIEYLKHLISQVESSPGLGKVLDERPLDAPLLRLLVDHEILMLRRCRGARPSNFFQGNVEHDCTSKSIKEVSLYLLLSQSCNMSCIYCLAGSRTYGGNKPRKMSLQVALCAIRRYLDSVGEGGHLDVVFFGGEPLLNWDVAKAIMRTSRESLEREYSKRRLTFHLTTNLTLMPSDLGEWARDFGMSFLVDVDGPPILHDQTRTFRGGLPTHNIIAGHVEKLVRAGLRVSLRATVTSLNVGHMACVARHHRELGASSSALVALNPIDSDGCIVPDSLLPDPGLYSKGLQEALALSGWLPDELYPFNEFVGRFRQCAFMAHPCGAPLGNTPVIDTLGNVYPCIYWVGMEKLLVGNVGEGKSYSREGIYEELQSKLHVDRIPRCKRCAYRYLCGGGCPAREMVLEWCGDASPKVMNYVNEISCQTARTVIDELIWRECDRVNSGVQGSRMQEAGCVNSV